MDETIKLLMQNIENISGRIKALQEVNSNFKQEIGAGRFSLETGKKVTDALDDQLQAIGQNIEELKNTVQKIGPIQPEPLHIKAEDLAERLRSVVDTIQLQSLQPQQAGVATVIKNMDVEIKGLITVQDGEIQIITPTTIAPENLSTIRWSFSTVPALRPPVQKPPA